MTKNELITGLKSSFSVMRSSCTTMRTSNYDSKFFSIQDKLGEWLMVFEIQKHVKTCYNKYILSNILKSNHVIRINLVRIFHKLKCVLALYKILNAFSIILGTWTDVYRNPKDVLFNITALA